MFKSGLLDRFTRVHHAVPVLIFAPGDRRCCSRTGVGRVGPAHRRSGYVLGGYAVWTLAEYWIHRVIFHFEPEEGIGARLHWMVHGVHHDHPNDPLRLVMPPAGARAAGAGLLRRCSGSCWARTARSRSAPASWPATWPTT